MRTIPRFPPSSSQIESGYIKTRPGEGALALAWWNQCARRNQPYVRLNRRGRSASLTYDLLPADRRLTPEARAALRRTFDGRAKSWGIGGNAGHASGIRNDVADALARFVINTLRPTAADLTMP